MQPHFPIKQMKVEDVGGTSQKVLDILQDKSPSLEPVKTVNMLYPLVAVTASLMTLNMDSFSITQ